MASKHTGNSLLTSKYKYKDIDEIDLKSLPLKNNDSFSLFHTNIRSLSKNYRELCLLLANANQQFDAIVLSETWSTNLELFGNLFPNYDYYFDSRINKASGICMFINNLTCKIVDVKFNLLQDCEDLWITLKTKNGLRTICSLYRSPNLGLENFMFSLESQLKTFKSPETLILVGDLNLDLLQYNCNKGVQNFYDMILNLNFYPLINSITRHQGNSKSIIDNIFVNSQVLLNNRNEISSYNVRTNISDHFTQIMLLTKLQPTRKDFKLRPYIRSYAEKYIVAFKNTLEKLSCPIIDEANVYDCNMLFEDFFTTLNNAHSQCFPLKRISRKQYANSPWFSKTLKKMYDKKVKLYRAWKQSNGIQQEVEYKNYLKFYKLQLKTSEVEYYKGLFLNCSKNIKATWKIINSLLGKKQKKLNKINSLILNDETITSATEIANTFNEHFSTVAQKLNLNRSSEKFRLHCDDFYPNSFYFNEISLEELKRCLCGMNHNKSTIDEIPLRIFKIIPDKWLAHLAVIINLSIKEGRFPDILKCSKTIPVFKKGCKSDVNNYRPITLLSYVTKLIENLIKQRMISFLDQRNFFYEQQYGFRNKHSTELAVLNVCNQIYDNLDRSKFSLLLTLDLNKAFDTLNHDILLDKLNRCGFRCFMLQWFQSYLRNRPISTLANGVLSDSRCLVTGVPQGSTLGPLMFLIYINDIKNVLIPGQIRCFADDTNVLFCNDSTVELFKEANKGLTQIAEYFNDNLLKLNPKKCNYILIFPRKKRNLSTSQMCLQLDNYNIEKVDSITYLGIDIDENMTFKNHIDKVVRKMRKWLPICHKLKKVIPQDELTRIYFAHIYSVMSYGAVIYLNTYPTHFKRLVNLHRKIINILKQAKSCYVNTLMPVFNSKDFLDPEKLYRFKILSIADKIIHHHHMLPGDFLRYVKLRLIKSHSARNRNNFKIPMYKTVTGQRNVTFQIASLWNKLPEPYRIKIY